MITSETSNPSIPTNEIQYKYNGYFVFNRINEKNMKEYLFINIINYPIKI